MFNNKKNIAIYILFLNQIEILLIPYFLGYFLMGRADDLTYLGYLNQIKITGFISESNIYPACSFIASFLSLITNVQPSCIVFLLSLFISSVFIIGMIIFLRQFIDKSEVFLISLLSLFFFYFSHYHFFSLTPHYFFFSMIPFYLFILNKYLKNKSLSISIVMVLFVISTPFTHPFIVLFMAYFFSVIIILNKLLRFKFPGLRTNLVLLSVGFLFWFISNRTFLVDLEQVYRSYINQLTEPVYLETTKKFSVIDLDSFDFIKLINLYYGRYYIPTIFIIVFIIIIFKNFNQFKKFFIEKIFTLIILYIALFVLESIFLFNPVISHQPDRLTNLNFIVFAQIPLFAYSLYFIFLRKSHSTKNVFMVLFILTVIWSLSFFGALYSPAIMRPNEAITYNEVIGMKWFYQNKLDYPVGVPLSQINRFHDLFGDNFQDKNKKIPDHFGYNYQNQTFSETNLEKNEQMYIVILSIDELLYQKVPGYIKVNRYSKADYDQFKTDKSVEKIYASLNIEIFRSYR
jgi:hypothetical protein